MSEKDAYRDSQIKFVSGLTGGYIWEVLILSVVIPALSALLRAILHVMIPNSQASGFPNFALDFMILVAPSILSFTVLESRALQIPMAMALAAAMLVSISTRLAEARQRDKMMANIGKIITNYFKEPFAELRTYVTAVRSYCVILTCIAILAVDFTIFPRRFAKTETFGIGLMDTGVGYFIIMNAVVSPAAQGKTSNLSLCNKLLSLPKVVLKSLPILILGFVRLASVKGTDYQEHVTEYGVHWNFFFTLFFVQVLSVVTDAIVPKKMSLLVPIFLAVFHEYALRNFGVIDYVLGETPREDNLLAANREGIFSILGYVCINLLATEFAKSCLYTQTTRLKATVKVVGVTLSTYLIYYGLWLSGFQCSRRLTNLPYIVSCLMILCGHISMGIVMDFILHVYITLARSAASPKTKAGRNHESQDSVTEKARDFRLLNAVNSNCLAYFLLANVLTGLVNLSMRTIDASRMTGLLVVLSYTFALSSVFTLLHSRKIRIKFW